MKKLILIVMALCGISLSANEVNDSNIASFKAQCEARNGDACNKAGAYYSNKYSHSRNTDIEARDLQIKYYTKGCELRNGNSCGGLGVHYAVNENNTTKALEFYKKGCDYKYANSCNSVGHIYWDKARNEQDKRKKKEYEFQQKMYYKKSCDLDNVVGCSKYKEL